MHMADSMNLGSENGGGGGGGEGVGIIIILLYSTDVIHNLGRATKLATLH